MYGWKGILDNEYGALLWGLDKLKEANLAPIPALAPAPARAPEGGPLKRLGNGGRLEGWARVCAPGSAPRRD